jgi:hypothetical protein
VSVSVYVDGVVEQQVDELERILRLHERHQALRVTFTE